MRRRAKELLQYNEKVRASLENIKEVLPEIKKLSIDFGYEVSVLEPFPESGYCYGIGEKFREVSELKRWATQILANHTVIAVDGSQIGFDRHVSPRVAMVQTGYSAMVRGDPFNAGFAYTGTFPKLYGPRDLAETLDEGAGLSGDATINFWRWKHETETLRCLVATLRREPLTCNHCRNIDDCPLLELKPKTPIQNITVLIDGTIILSFLRHTLRKAIREAYINELEEVLSFCEKRQVAIAGIIMSSGAKEVSKSLWKIANTDENLSGDIEQDLPTDPFLFSEFLKLFGDRSPVMLSHRAVLSEYRKYSSKIGFFYLRVDSHLPARVEVPSFVYKQGLLENLWHAISAECILGRGYPYTLARAHDAAVLKGDDRNRFYTILDGILKGYGSCIRVSSKNRRKVIPLV